MAKLLEQLSFDLITGEDIYFGKPENRRLPQIGDECFVLIENEYHKAKVIRKTKCYFFTEVIEGEHKGAITLPPGIKNERFRPLVF